jgi:hypothetical protein
MTVFRKAAYGLSEIRVIPIVPGWMEGSGGERLNCQIVDDVPFLQNGE